jgi:hypothetical protein
VSAKLSPDSALAPKKTPLPPGRPINVAVELWVEVITDLNKNNPCFAHVSPPQDREVTRITIAYNLAWWPTSGAAGRGDQNALKWLGALALVDRALTWRGHPILKASGDHLAHIAGCPQDFKRGLWVAYKLKDNPLLERVPQLVSDSMQPQKFAEFSVTVDSNKLSDFRARMARRFRKRPEHQSAAHG